MKTLYLLPLFLFLCSVSSALLAETSIDLAKHGLIYTPAVATKEPEFHFPNSAKMTRQESFIKVRYDVDTEGRAHNFHLVRGTGTEVFDKFLELHLDGWKMQPAMRDGQAITQRNLRYNFTFTLNNRMKKKLEQRMRPNFHEIYIKMVKSLKAGDYESFDQYKDALMQVRIANFTETRRLWVLMNSYYQRTNGSIHDRIYSLRRASQIDARDPDTKEFLLKIYANLMKEQMRAGQISSAMQSFINIINEGNSDDYVKELGPLYDEAESIVVSGQTMQAEYRVEEIGLVQHSLYRPSFIIDTEASIEHAQLVCDKFNVEFEAKPQVEYIIPVEWGSCRLTLQMTEGDILKIKEFSEQNKI